MASNPVRLVLIAIAMCTVVNALDQADIDAILSLHNNARGAVSPTATNMMRIEWDADLAVKAQAYADSCPTGHSKAPNVGENLSWGWPTMTANEAVTEWINELNDFSYDAAACINNKVCNHYTQLIWAETSKVGCGKASCKNLFGNPQADAWVCQYTSAGNYVGEKPYLSGTTCSACPNSTVCSENLCSPPGAGTNAPTSTTAPTPTTGPTSTSNAPGSITPATDNSNSQKTAAATTNPASPSVAATPSTTGTTSSPATAGTQPTTNAAAPSTVAGAPSGSGTNAAAPTTSAGLTQSPSPVANALSSPSSPTSVSTKKVTTPTGSLSTPTLSIVDDSQGATTGHFQKPHSKTLAPTNSGIRLGGSTSNTSNSTGNVIDKTLNQTSADFITILGFPKKSFF